jgi:amino acid permease
MSRPLVVVAIVLGIVFLGFSAYYWLTPAESLPSFMPGYIAGDAGHHLKHALVSLVIALALFALAWFRSKPARA